jgi:hypothetical protein
MGKSISRKGGKSQRAQREQSSYSLRVFAPWRLCVRLFVFSQLLCDVCDLLMPGLRLGGADSTGRPTGRRHQQTMFAMQYHNFLFF